MKLSIIVLACTLTVALARRGGGGHRPTCEDGSKPHCPDGGRPSLCADGSKPSRSHGKMKGGCAKTDKVCCDGSTPVWDGDRSTKPCPDGRPVCNKTQC